MRAEATSYVSSSRQIPQVSISARSRHRVIPRDEGKEDIPRKTITKKDLQFILVQGHRSTPAYLVIL